MERAKFSSRFYASLLDLLFKIPLFMLLLDGIFKGHIFMGYIGTAGLMLYRPILQFFMKGTFGELTMNLNVVNEGGKRISIIQAFVRNILFVAYWGGNMYAVYYIFEHGKKYMAVIADPATHETLDMLNNVSAILLISTLPVWLYALINKEGLAIHGIISKTQVIKKING